MVCGGTWLLKSGRCAIGAAETALLFEAGMDVVKARSLASVGIIATGSELRDFVCRAEGPTRGIERRSLSALTGFWMPVSAMYGREVQLTILRPLRPHSLDLRCALTF